MPVSATTRVKQIFLEAAERVGSERKAYLDDVCAGDDALRSRVESYLRAEEGAGDFLSQPDGQSSFADLIGAPPPEVPGTELGRYKLVELIGEGGFGTVYRAEQLTPIRRTVALKIIKAGMDTRQVIARFEAERQALAMLEHPNIARVLDAGETSAGRPYFVMELVDGLPITHFCDENKLSTVSRLELFELVCGAVQHAHQRGIIHRDIKPGNILVAAHDGKPVPRLIDFGIAKATQTRLTDRTLLTESRQPLGTPAYMSPEQAQISGLELDTRTDIYSLGVLLYELLTGTTPHAQTKLRSSGQSALRRIFQETDAPKPSACLGTLGARLSAVAADRRTDPRRLATLLRGELDWIAMKAMEKDRARRYQSAGEFARDVQRYLNDQPVEACPPTAAYLARKFAGRHRRTVVTTALATLFAVAAAVIYVVSIRREQANTQAALLLAREQRAQADRATVRARDAEREADRELAQATVARARASLAGPLPGRRFESLASLANVAKNLSSLDVRSQAAGCLAVADIRINRQWKGPGDGICFSHDCTMYVDSDPANGDVMLCRVPAAGAAPGPPIVRLPGQRAGQLAAFSSDDRFFAMNTADGHVRCFSTDGTPVRSFAGGPAFDFAPGAAMICVATAGGPIAIYDLKSGDRIREIDAVAGYRLRFSPDGKRIATWNSFNQPQRRIAVYEIDSGQLTELPFFWGALQLVWHPSGTRLAVGDLDSKIYQWDVSTPGAPAPLPALSGHNAAVGEVAFSHGGDLLASASVSDHSIRIWDAVTGLPLLRIGGSGQLSFSPDDRWLSTTLDGQDRHQLAEIASGRERRAFIPPAGYTQRTIAFTADGSLMACGGTNVIRFWNLSDGLPYTAPLDLPVKGESVWEAAFSPDGTVLAFRTDHGLFKVDIHEAVEKSPAGSGAVVSRMTIGTKVVQILPLPVAHPGSLAFTADGRRIALAHYFQQPRLVDLADQARNVIFAGSSRETIFSAVSPDQNWFAAGRWKSLSGPAASVWEVRSGKRVCDVPVDFTAEVGFSPDGKLLAVCSPQDLRLLEVGSWKTVLTRPRNLGYVEKICFSNDSRLLAVSPRNWGVQLIDVKSGLPVVTLDDLDQEQPIKFGPDDGQLVTWCIDGTIRLWDLRRIREELSQMNLDWPAPPLPARPHVVPLVLVLGVDPD